MIQEFWKQGGGKGKGLQCLHEQAFTYTENQDDKSWEGYITNAKLAELHVVLDAANMIMSMTNRFCLTLLDMFLFETFHFLQ